MIGQSPNPFLIFPSIFNLLFPFVWTRSRPQDTINFNGFSDLGASTVLWHRLHKQMTRDCRATDTTALARKQYLLDQVYRGAPKNKLSVHSYRLDKNQFMHARIQELRPYPLLERNRTNHPASFGSQKANKEKLTSQIHTLCSARALESFARRFWLMISH
jgi:hypothetical protein